MERALVILLSLMLLPSVATAQGTVELSETQRGYNEKGVTAIRDGRYDVAISSFESSLVLGSANVIHLNLGRAYQRSGRCLEAKTEYGKVAAAPAVEAPTREEVLSVLIRYSGELPAVCPAKITVKCDDPQTLVAVDGAEGVPCGAKLEIEVAGEATHAVVATLGQLEQAQDVAVKEGEKVDVAVALVAAEPPKPPEEKPVKEVVQAPDPVIEPAPAVAATSPLKTVGLVLGAAGAAGVTASLLLDATYVKGAVKPCSSGDFDELQCDFDAAKSAKLVNTAVLSIGGGLLVAGAILYFVGGSAETGVGLHYDRGPGISYTTRF